MELSQIFKRFKNASVKTKIWGIFFAFYLFFFFYWGREEGFREIPTKVLTPIFLLLAISNGALNIFFNSTVIKSYIFLAIFGIISFFWVTENSTYSRQVQMMLGIIAIGLVLFHFVRRYNIAALGFLTIGVSALLLLRKGFEISSVSFSSALVDLSIDNTLKSFEENENTLALLYLIGICSVFAFKSKFTNKYINLVSYFGAAALIYGISLTGSRSTLIVSAVLVLFDFVADKSVKMIYKIIMLVLFWVFALGFLENIFFLTGAGEKFLNTGSTKSDLARERMIIESWQMFANNPFIGVGLGNVVTLSTFKLYAHNEFLEIMATMGIVGLVLYCSFLFYYFKTIRKLRDINVFVYNAFLNNFFVYVFMGLFGVWFTDAFFYILLFIQLAEAERLIFISKSNLT
jgi:hypothetical protein